MANDHALFVFENESDILSVACTLYTQVSYFSKHHYIIVRGERRRGKGGKEISHDSMGSAANIREISQAVYTVRKVLANFAVFD